MKIGTKFFDSESLLKPLEKQADFIEVMAIEGKDYRFLNHIKKPIIIHAQHGGFGVNNADKTKYEKNLSSIHSIAGQNCGYPLFL